MLWYQHFVKKNKKTPDIFLQSTVENTLLSVTTQESFRQCNHFSINEYTTNITSPKHLKNVKNVFMKVNERIQLNIYICIKYLKSPERNRSPKTFLQTYKLINVDVYIRNIYPPVCQKKKCSVVTETRVWSKRRTRSHLSIRPWKILFPS